MKHNIKVVDEIRSFSQQLMLLLCAVFSFSTIVIVGLENEGASLIVKVASSFALFLGVASLIYGVLCLLNLVNIFTGDKNSASNDYIESYYISEPIRFVKVQLNLSMLALLIIFPCLGMAVYISHVNPKQNFSPKVSDSKIESLVDSITTQNKTIESQYFLLKKACEQLQIEQNCCWKTEPGHFDISCCDYPIMQTKINNKLSSSSP